MKANEDTLKKILPKSHRLRVVHFHEGNDPDGRYRTIDGRIYPYVTVAVVLGPSDEILATGRAVCSKKDQPDRKLGRRIAVGRVCRNWL